MEFTCNNVEQVRRCEASTTFPISGHSGYTELIIFKSYAVTGTQAILNHGLFGNGKAFIVETGANGNVAISGEWPIGGARSAGGVISLNARDEFAVTRHLRPIT